MKRGKGKGAEERKEKEERGGREIDSSPRKQTTGPTLQTRDPDQNCGLTTK